LCRSLDSLSDQLIDELSAYLRRTVSIIIVVFIVYRQCSVFVASSITLCLSLTLFLSVSLLSLVFAYKSIIG